MMWSSFRIQVHLSKKWKKEMNERKSGFLKKLADQLEKI